MTRLLVLPLLVGLACLVAGLYGMIHNQISYTVGPEYFTELKFRQFRIAEAMPHRIGAAIVGWRASWWMGLLIGPPIALAGLLLPDPRHLVRAFLQAALIVTGTTLGLGLASLAVTLDESRHALFRIPATVGDPAGFVRAALMHETSYAAGLVGLLLGVGWMVRSARRARRAATRKP